MSKKSRSRFLSPVANTNIIYTLLFYSILLLLFFLRWVALMNKHNIPYVTLPYDYINNKYSKEEEGRNRLLYFVRQKYSGWNRARTIQLLYVNIYIIKYILVQHHHNITRHSLTTYCTYVNMYILVYIIYNIYVL